MRNLINWIKSNPITIVSFLVGLFSIVFLAWVLIQGEQFRSETESHVGKQLRELNNYIDRPVTVPSSEADQPPVQYQIAVNERAINRLDVAYRDMTGEYEDIFTSVVQFNHGDHKLLHEDLFPRMANLAAGYEARVKYRNALEKMLSPSSGDSLLPQLNAGMPPSPEEMQEVVDQAYQQYIQHELALGVDLKELELTAKQQESLQKHQRQRLEELLRERARSIHIYAQTNMASADYPLIIGDWLGSSDKPPIGRLWEAQMELWIQQDVLEAIARANRTRDYDVNVRIAPVKQLISIGVIPGYVGVHTDGALRGSSSSSLPADGIYSVPKKAEYLKEFDNFNVSPTGRASNALYDVRHVRVKLIVDYHKLSELFNTFSQVNFMTVIDCRLEDVDDFEAMQRGYYYDQGDAFKAELVLETIWMRQWTTRWMPDVVKASLGLSVSMDEDEDAG